MSEGDAYWPYFTLGQVYFALKNYELAEKNLVNANEISKHRKDLHNQKAAAKILSDIYSAKGNISKSNEFLVVYYQMKDSLDKMANAEELLYKELNYENEKKEALLKAEQERQNSIHDEEQKKQRIITYSVTVGLFLVGLFAFFAIRSLKNSRRINKIIAQQKTEVEGQKRLIEEKQTEILDSIRYARRIQHSLLPTEKYIDKVTKKVTKT
jgi:hypothetical protein